jgi:hypothetical protein
MLQGLRRSLWREKCYTDARNSVKNSMRNGSAWTKQPTFNETTAIKDKAMKLLELMTFEWFPNYWLTFIYLV